MRRLSIERVWVSSVITATVLANGFCGVAQAHEMRHLGGDSNNGEGANVFMVHVGFLNEPAFSEEMNGIDFSMSFHPDAAHDKSLTQPVDTTKGDVVRLTRVEVHYYPQGAVDSGGVKKKALRVDTDDSGNIKKKWGTDSTYPVYFKPTKEGVYGFRLKGIAQHGGSSLSFDETFICGDGTKDLDKVTGKVKSKFGCVQNPVEFPANRNPVKLRR